MTSIMNGHMLLGPLDIIEEIIVAEKGENSQNDKINFSFLIISWAKVTNKFHKKIR